MCGICGILASARSETNLELACRQMADSIKHRGPDDKGLWIDKDARIALGHRRLAVIDLSPLGRQPMESKDKRYVVSFNGEIYNFLEIRKELENFGYSFSSNSDTEVLLAAISHWGLRHALHRLIGMFAFALWDNKEQQLHLVRDRLGIKPLYYGWSQDSSFLFSSELKAFRKVDSFDHSIDLEALAMFFRHNYVPAPFSIYKDARKLLPGSVCTVDRKDLSTRTVHLNTYWKIDEIWKGGMSDPWSGTDEEAVEVLESLLKDSISRRMVSDVPLGAFLSGGIDSSTVTALMRTVSSQPIRTFSIGFHEKAYNEAPIARAVSRHLGTEHTELYVTEDDAMKIVPNLCQVWDEPFADSSQIPTFLLSFLTKQHVTVALSGDGGDELFLGYPRYLATLRLWKTLRTASFIPSILRTFPPSFLDSLDWIGRPVMKALGTKGSVNGILRRLRELSTSMSFSQFYGYSNSHFQPYGCVVKGIDCIAPQLLGFSTSSTEYWSTMALVDIKTYLPDDILTKVDRASMATSLEVRVPILDHRIVELAARLPTQLKMRNNVSKWILRQVLYKYIPEPLVDRPKMGFGVPIGRWLRSGLREWASDLLSSRRLKADGYLDVDVASKIWKAHLSCKANHQYVLWNILMFQSWLEEWK